MQVPLQITFRHMTPSPALEERARVLAQRLERFSQQIIQCHLVVEAPAKHHRQGEPFDVGLEILVPGRQIVIRRPQASDARQQDAYVALRDAFRTARRRLQAYERERADPRRVQLT